LDEVGEQGLLWNDEAMLKSLITRTDYEVELKGQEKRAVKNYNNYIFTTNCQMPIEVDPGVTVFCNVVINTWVNMMNILSR